MVDASPSGARDQVCNVSEACRRHGVSRTLCSRLRRRLEQDGAGGVHPKRQQTRWGRPPSVPVPTGAARDRARLAVLERASVATTGLLTERTVKTVRHVEAAQPGNLHSLDMLYVGNLKGVGKVSARRGRPPAVMWRPRLAGRRGARLPPGGRQDRRRTEAIASFDGERPWVGPAGFSSIDGPATTAFGAVRRARRVPRGLAFPAACAAARQRRSRHADARVVRGAHARGPEAPR